MTEALVPGVGPPRIYEIPIGAMGPYQADLYYPSVFSVLNVIASCASLVPGLHWRGRGFDESSNMAG